LTLNLALRQAALGLLLLACAPAWPADGPPPLEEIRQALRDLALDPPTEEDLRQLAAPEIDRQLRALDPYAELLSPGRSNGAANPLRLGAEIYRRDDQWWLLPYQGGPLQQAGVGERTVLEAVGERPVAALSASELAALLTPPKGEGLRLTLRRIGATQSERVAVRPAPFTAPSVELLPLERAPVLRIRAFVGRETLPFLTGAIAQASKSGPLIIDLRDALGGDLFEALDCAALFLPAGALLANTRDRAGQLTPYRSQAGAKVERPLRLLVGPDTASAAEVFAAILQHYRRAVLIGRTTRGKCRSQTLAALSGGYRLRLTNLAVLPAGGQDCQGKGIQPDVVVDEKELYATAALVERTLRPRNAPSAGK